MFKRILLYWVLRVGILNLVKLEDNTSYILALPEEVYDTLTTGEGLKSLTKYTKNCSVLLLQASKNTTVVKL